MMAQHCLPLPTLRDDVAMLDFLKMFGARGYAIEVSDLPPTKVVVPSGETKFARVGFAAFREAVRANPDRSVTLRYRNRIVAQS